MTLEYGVVKFFGVITLHFFFLLTPNAPLIAYYTVTKTNKRTDVGKKKKHSTPMRSLFYVFGVSS